MEGRRDREEWIDIAKGIGIILVVFCHIKVSFLTTYIYWFHMPLFFLISGYLHRQPDSLTEIFSVSVQKTYRLLIPYLSYYILILFCMVFFGLLQFYILQKLLFYGLIVLKKSG